jgi:uncharacterized protein YecE (DUF72 family)
VEKIQWYIGCSGFAYKEWKEIFYPSKLPQKDWFSFYAQHFNSLELNVSFYRFPTLKAMQGWYDQAPDNFVFSVKVHRSVTHFKKLNDVTTVLEDFYGLVKEGIKEKLACVLFQMPPKFAYSPEQLQKLISAADPNFHNVVEFRDESWWRKDVQDELRKNSIGFCGVSFPKIVYDDAVVNGPLAYYRFHGVPKLFYSEYEESFLEKIFNQVNSAEGVESAYLYFNNTASVAALKNARFMQSLLT